MDSLRLFLSLFLFSPWLIRSAYGEGVRLVDIYCAEVQRQSSPAWDELAARLDTRTGGPTEDERASAPFLTCVAQNETAFSTAEFAWQGRESLRQATLHYLSSRKAAEVTVGVVGTDFELPYVGSVSVESLSPKAGEGADPLGYAERARRYEELWADFLAGLKSRLSTHAADGQVALNTR